MARRVLLSAPVRRVGAFRLFFRSLFFGSELISSPYGNVWPVGGDGGFGSSFFFMVINLRLVSRYPFLHGKPPPPPIVLLLP